jgi:hypothetical protein
MTSYSQAAKHARLSALATEIGSSPLLRIYSGSAPANADAALSGNTLLAELPMSATPFAAPSGGTMTANAITADASADATGTAAFARIYKSGGSTCVVQLSVGTSGAEVNLSTLSIVSGGNVSCTSMVVTGGN